MAEAKTKAEANNKIYVHKYAANDAPTSARGYIHLQPVIIDSFKCVSAYFHVLDLEWVIYSLFFSSTTWDIL